MTGFTSSVFTCDDEKLAAVGFYRIGFLSPGLILRTRMLGSDFRSSRCCILFNRRICLNVARLSRKRTQLMAQSEQNEAKIVQVKEKNSGKSDLSSSAEESEPQSTIVEVASAGEKEKKRRGAVNTEKKRRPMTAETRRKISEALSGRKLSSEHKKNISLKFAGSRNHRFGKGMAEETKQKISRARKGHVVPDHVRQKISASKRASAKLKPALTEEEKELKRDRERASRKKMIARALRKREIGQDLENSGRAYVAAEHDAYMEQLRQNVRVPHAVVKAELIAQRQAERLRESEKAKSVVLCQTCNGRGVSPCRCVQQHSNSNASCKLCLGSGFLFCERCQGSGSSQNGNYQNARQNRLDR
mmetsp:Transcript_11670/g.21128  ORF Transcript_11670/g.21128 Transcript_11670/m.21128 type:complete len:360 (+) Transcript_11670:156-1235(+)